MMTETEQQAIVEAGQQAWLNMSDDARNRALLGQQRSKQLRTERAQEKYSSPLEPRIKLNNEVWKCNGTAGESVCGFACAKQLTLM